MVVTYKTMEADEVVNAQSACRINTSFSLEILKIESRRFESPTIVRIVGRQRTTLETRAMTPSPAFFEELYVFRDGREHFVALHRRDLCVTQVHRCRSGKRLDEFLGVDGFNLPC